MLPKISLQLCNNIVFQYINVCQAPRELLKTSAFGLGFQHLPRDLANVNAWKTMFDPYSKVPNTTHKEKKKMIMNEYLHKYKSNSSNLKVSNQ